MTRFDHIKNQAAHSKITRDTFIEGATTTPTAAVEKPKRVKDNSAILLVGSGKISKQSLYAKPAILLNLRQDIQNKIATHCSGNRQIILNYLIEKGLQQLIEHGVCVIQEAD